MKRSAELKHKDEAHGVISPNQRRTAATIPIVGLGGSLEAG